MGVVVVFIFFIVVPFIALALAYVTIFQDGARSTGRWGVRRKTVVIQDASPYRAANGNDEVARGAPVWLRVVSGLSVIGGVGTMTLLAPAGLLLTLIVADKAGPLVVPVLLVSLSGFVAGALLVRVARNAARHQQSDGSMRYYLYIHHAAVAITMVCVDFYSLEVALFSVPICAVVIVFIALLDFGPRIHIERASPVPNAPSLAPVAEPARAQPPATESDEPLSVAS